MSPSPSTSRSATRSISSIPITACAIRATRRRRSRSKLLDRPRLLHQPRSSHPARVDRRRQQRRPRRVSVRQPYRGSPRRGQEELAQLNVSERHRRELPRCLRKPGMFFHRACRPTSWRRAVALAVQSSRSKTTSGLKPPWPGRSTSLRLVKPRSWGFVRSAGWSTRCDYNPRPRSPARSRSPAAWAAIAGKASAGPLVVSRTACSANALRYSPMRKRMALALGERAGLRRASVIHALNRSKPVRSARSGWPIRSRRSRTVSDSCGKPRGSIRTGQSGCCSRAHPSRRAGGADRGRVQAERSPGYAMAARHRRRLGRRPSPSSGGCRASKLGDSIAFLGPLFGAAKRERMAMSDAFILPTFSEGAADRGARGGRPGCRS